MKRANLRRLSAVARKEFIHVRRDWRSLVLAIAIPVVLILLFGYALTMDLKNVPTAVWDQSNTPQSRQLLSLFDGSPYFSLVSCHDNYRDIEKALNRGHAAIALVIPADLAAALQSNRSGTIQVIADGSDANTARLALGYTRALGLIYSRRLTAERLRLAGRGEFPPPIALETRVWYNQALRSPNVIIPGIIAIVMVVIAAMLTSVTIAREWETGTMEQLLGTPLRAWELVCGKVVPYFFIGMADVTLAVGMGRLLFGVPLTGSAALAFTMASVFLLGALFFGLMVSIVMKSQVLANQIALVAAFLPTMLLSGFVFAIENMPPLIQAITFAVPARYFIALLRGIFLKGVGLEILWLNALLLLLYALVMIVLANKKMHMKLE